MNPHQRFLKAKVDRYLASSPENQLALVKGTPQIM